MAGLRIGFCWGKPASAVFSRLRPDWQDYSLAPNRLPQTRKPRPELNSAHRQPPVNVEMRGGVFVMVDRRERMFFFGDHLMTADFTAINSRMGCRGAGFEEMVKDGVAAVQQIIIVLIMGHSESR